MSELWWALAGIIWLLVFMCLRAKHEAHSFWLLWIAAGGWISLNVVGLLNLLGKSRDVLTPVVFGVAFVVVVWVIWIALCWIWKRIVDTR